MKQILLTALLLLTLNSYSQDSSVCMPYSIAKQISLDLISGDSAKEMLGVVIDELSVKDQKLALKDSVIGVHKAKEINLTTQYNNEKLAKESYITLYSNLEGEYKRVYAQYRKQKFVNRIYKVGFWSGLAIGIAGYIILTKPF